MMFQLKLLWLIRFSDKANNFHGPLNVVPLYIHSKRLKSEVTGLWAANPGSISEVARHP